MIGVQFVLINVLISLYGHTLCFATIFSNSLQLCYDQCIDRNLALPLPTESLVWHNISTTNCDFDCLVDACRSGCKDLESLNSTCDLRCNSIGDGSAACHQGCRAVADLFLHQLQQLVELVSVEAFLDVGLGVGLNWSFSDQQATIIQEISTTNIRWMALSRASGTSTGWRWTPMEEKTFREPNVQLHATIFVPMEQHSDIELQLVALWRDIAVVSRPFLQTVLLPLGSPASMPARRRLKPTVDISGGQLQLALNGFVACWRTEERVTDVHETSQFRLRLFAVVEDGSGTFIRSQFTNTTCHFFRNLPDQYKQFQLAIADVGTDTTPVPTLSSSTEGTKKAFDEDELVLNITLQQLHDVAATHGGTPSASVLVFSDGISLYVLDKLDDFVMLTEPSKIAFALNSSQSITALGCVSETELLLGLSDGAMFRLDIEEWLHNFNAANNPSPAGAQQQMNNSTTALSEQIVHAERIRAPDGVAITQIVASVITERIYAVRDKLGIVRCQFRTCENSTTLTLTNSPNFIYRLAEDAWNGFLYYATNSGDVFSTPMLPLDATQNYSLSITRRLAELPPVSSLEVDLHEQKLVAISRTGQLISRDLINGTVRDEREGWTLSDTYRNVVHAQFYRNRLFWTSSSCGDSHPWESCLYSEEFDHGSKAVHLSKYLYSGPVKEFVLLRPFIAPPFMVPPSKVGLLLTDSEALLSWRPPTSLPFQAIGSAWRSLAYEYILQFQPDHVENEKNDTVQTSTTVSQGKILTTHITVPVGPESVDGTYNLTIRACTRNICSSPVITSNRPFHADKMRKTITLYTKKSTLAEGGGIGGGQPSADPFLLLDMLGRDVPADRTHLYPKFPSVDAATVSIAYDNSSGVLYQSWQKDFTVTRSIEGTAAPLSAHFLDSVHFHMVALLVSRATILLASAYSVFAYRTTSSFNKIVYNCQPLLSAGGEECGKVYGIATEEDHPQKGPGRVFLLVMLPSGVVQLLSSSSDLAQPFQLVATTNHFPYKIRQMAFADDRLLILTDDGFFGTIDLTLQTINLNFAVRDIQFLLAGDYVESIGDHRIHFEGPIQFDEKLGQFSWTISSWQNTLHKEVVAPSVVAIPIANGVQSLYKLSLFRDAFGGERIVLLSQASAYQLPQRLIQAWNSRQKFDLLLEAYNPWTAVALNRSALLTPTKPPSAPRNVRIFATQHRTVDGTRAIIDLFWDEPKEWNGDQLGYTVNCTIVATVPAGQQQGSSDVQSVNATLRRGTNRAYTFSVRSGKISCLIFAMNDQQLVGPPSSPPAEIDGSEFKPLIRLFAIDSTDNLVAIQNWTIESSVKNSVSNGNKARFLAKNRKRQIAHTVQYQAMTYVGSELYAIRKEPEMSQLALVKLDINQVDTVLSKASLLGEVTQIDAMAADWVANRLLLVGKRELTTIHLDQLQDSPSTVLLKKLFPLSLGAQDAKQLVYDPFTNTAYLLTKNGSLFALDLNRGIESNLELTTGCLRQKTITSIVGEFVWNKAASPQLYALTWNGLIELKLNSDNNCPDINVNWSLFGETGLKAISLFTVADKVLVFATPNDLLVYDRQTAAVSQFPSPSPPIRQLLAVSQSSQPFPNRDCFQLPPASQISFNVKNEGRTGAVVEVHELQLQKDAQQQQPNECVNVSQPITQYDVHFRKRGTDKHQQEKIKTVHSSSNRIVVDNGVLEKYTDYDVTVSWLNHYCPPQGQSEAKLLHTGFGYPLAPKEPKALALTPDTVLLSWTLPDLLSAPVAEIRYRVSQLSPALANPVPVAVRPAEGTAGHFSAALAEVVPCESNPCQAKVPNLRPSTDYHFWVVALHINRLNADDAEATSTESQAHTRDIPGTLRLENVTSDSMFLRWNTLMSGVDASFAQFVQISIQYRQSGVDASWTDVRNSTFALTDWPQRFLCVDQLHPATAYDYRYAAEYTIFAANVWAGAASTAATASAVDGKAAQQQLQLQQKDGGKKAVLIETFFQQSQQARTKAGTPSTPLDVKLANEQGCAYDTTTKQSDWPTGKCESGGWTLRWAEPNFDGGEPIQNYAVEYRASGQTEWEIAERGLPPDRLFWRVAWTETHARRGKTPSDEELAQGQFRVRAANVEGFGEFGYTPSSDKSAAGDGTTSISFWLYMLLALFTLLVLACCAACGYLHWKMAERKHIRLKLHKPICMESIGQQIQFPQSSHKFSPEVQNELKTLPRLSAECVKATKELGMGSFGRVCEGFMRTKNSPTTPAVRVAIKYLKDNNEENRVKFLKEAILMKNFDHPNIVKLLGVSMEGEQFLVLELMDGGDMRNFLRQSRPYHNRPSRVSLRELIAMIVDVGRGCVYLEKYKHVHRDLAARNCLISSTTSLQRVTKIADFGHARELFVDDYYRFRGGDLLPLRWLSPEVINQGLFTSKSDVWAFGVLLWEIVTLGEQPFAHMSNTQVLARLSSGMSLDRPTDCPNELYDVMKVTWTVDAEKRPQFADIQPRLETMRGLPTFQSRDPFPPPSSSDNFFDASQNSSTSKGELSSTTTTNGDGDSLTACQFDKSGESFSGRRNAKRSRHTIPRRTSTETSMGGGPSASYSFATASTGLESSEYEVPKSRPGLMMNMPELRHTNHRRSTGFHQNDAFVGDSSVDDAGGERFTQSISLAGTSRAAADEPLTTPFRQQFGASSSRVSRV